MNIQVKSELTFTLNNPTYDLRNAKGIIIHQLPDDNWLIEFKQMTQLRRGAFTRLQWYIHKQDLTIIE
jgi:hypothetical protein